MKKTTNEQNEWNWINNLHDAVIIDVIREKGPIVIEGKYYGNRICIEIDAASALFDTSIKSLTFYNCNESIPEMCINGFWWIEGHIYFEKGKYVLNIILGNKQITELVYTIRFTEYKVNRK